MTSSIETTANLEGLVQAGIEQGMQLQGQQFSFVRPAGRSAEEGLTLPEAVFQAIGAAAAEGTAAREGDRAMDYGNLTDIGHQLLAEVANQVR